MRRFLLAVMIAAVPLTFGTASAGAFQLPGGLGGSLPTSSMLSPQAVVAGTVTQVNSDGTFDANAYVVSPLNFLDGSGSGFGSLNLGGFGNILGNLGNLGNLLGSGSSSSPTTPTTTPVTISTDSNTKLLVNGQPGSVNDLAANDHFMALFPGWPWDSIQTLTANPATFIWAHSAPTPKSVYAFVGKVTGVDTTDSPETVTVTLTAVLPSGLASPGSSATFTVGDHTLIIDGSSSSSSSLIGGLGGSLTDVKPGDIVAGGLIGPAGDTLSQVEALPLGVLLDFPAPSSSSAASVRKAKARALKDALALLAGKSQTHHSHKHHKHHRHG